MRRSTRRANRRGLRRQAYAPGPFAGQHQPQREERIGQRGELRQRERRNHQARLVAIPSLHTTATSTTARGAARPGARSRSGEDVIRLALLVVRDVEALRLQIEHRPITPGKRHQLVVCAKLDDPAVFEYADTIGMADGGEPM